MKLAVVTFTNHSRPELLARCKRTVARWLPEDAEHVIVELDGFDNFGQARKDALNLAPVVCFVDDDDEVVNDSLRLCRDALLRHDAGFAFTDEKIIVQHTGASSVRDGRRTYEELFTDPWKFHHLTMYRTAYVPDLPTAGIVSGSEWLLKVGAGMTHGAVHVPVVGYNWWRYKASMLRKKTGKTYTEVQALADSYKGMKSGLVPQYKGK